MHSPYTSFTILSGEATHHTPASLSWVERPLTIPQLHYPGWRGHSPYTSFHYPGCTHHTPASLSWEERPLTIHQLPLYWKERPLTIHQLPLSWKERPLTIHQLPLSWEERPLTIHQLPLSWEERPLTIHQLPLSWEERPLTIHQLPLSWEERPLTIHQLPLSWVETQLETMATHFLKKWAGLAKSANPNILDPPKSDGGLDLPSLSSMYKRLQTSCQFQLPTSADHA